MFILIRHMVSCRSASVGDNGPGKLWSLSLDQDNLFTAKWTVPLESVLKLAWYAPHLIHQGIPSSKPVTREPPYVKEAMYFVRHSLC